MTNAEAITRLKGLYGNGYNEQEEALNMAINALSAIEDIRAELLKDYVDDNPHNFTVAIVNLKDVIEIIDKHLRGEQE